MMKLKHLYACVICAAIISGCSFGTVKPRDESDERYVFAMDTEMTLKAYGKNASKALYEAENEIKRLDHDLDRGEADSEIYKINTSGSGTVSDETARIIETALGVSKSSSGAFDITIAPVMDLWGFYTDEYNVPSEQDITDALGMVDYTDVTLNGNSVTLQNNVRIDLGGIAKGYLSSRIMEIMAESGVSSGMVSLGGNVQVLGAKPDGSRWKVAIQSPDNDGYVGVLSICDKAVITSGGYQRFFEHDGNIYHHIIDPSTGYPAQSGLKSVSIVSSDGAMADALSTALFIMGAEKGAEYWRSHGGFDVVFVTDDNKIIITEGIEDSFQCDSEYSVIHS